MNWGKESACVINCTQACKCVGLNKLIFQTTATYISSVKARRIRLPSKRDLVNRHMLLKTNLYDGIDAFVVTLRLSIIS